jgi:hypothetical protein
MDYRHGHIIIKIPEYLSLRFMIPRHVTADVLRQGRCGNGITGGYPEGFPPKAALHFLPAVKFWQSDLRISWRVAW